MERRNPKKTDQEVVQRAFNMLKNLIEKHSEIEPTLWAAAFWSILVHGYNASGVSYEEFTKELDKLKHHYKHWFDQ